MSLHRVKENPPCSPHTQDSNPELAAVLAKKPSETHASACGLERHTSRPSLLTQTREKPRPSSQRPAGGTARLSRIPGPGSPRCRARPGRTVRCRLRETGDNSNGGFPRRPVVHRDAKMAAPSEGRPGRGASPFPGTESGSFAFPFAVPHGAAGSGAESSSKKPCRACTDFKSWLREQRKRAAPGGGVRRRPLSRGRGGGGLPCPPGGLGGLSCPSPPFPAP